MTAGDLRALCIVGGFSADFLKLPFPPVEKDRRPKRGAGADACLGAWNEFFCLGKGIILANILTDPLSSVQTQVLRRLNGKQVTPSRLRRCDTGVLRAGPATPAKV